MKTNNVFLGICCARRDADVPGRTLGVLVASIDDQSPAAKAGMRAGDVILEINHQAVNGPEHAAQLGQVNGRDSVLLRVWTAGRSRYFLIERPRALTQGRTVSRSPEPE